MVPARAWISVVLVIAACSDGDSDDAGNDADVFRKPVERAHSNAVYQAVRIRGCPKEFSTSNQLLIGVGLQPQRGVKDCGELILRPPR